MKSENLVNFPRTVGARTSARLKAIKQNAILSLEFSYFSLNVKVWPFFVLMSTFNYNIARTNAVHFLGLAMLISVTLERYRLGN